jgi:hypothetical protein
MAIFLSPFQWTSSGHIKGLPSAKIFRQSPRTDLPTKRSARAVAHQNPMHARGPSFHFLRHNPSPCDPRPPQTREHPAALHPPAATSTPSSPAEAPPPQPREHTHSPPRPPHSLSGGRRRLTDDGHGASRGTLRTDAVDRSGGVLPLSERNPSSQVCCPGRTFSWSTDP